MLLDSAMASEKLNEALSNGRVSRILPYSTGMVGCKNKIEYCLFLKPELFSDSADLSLALDIISSRLPADTEVAGAAVLPGEYLRRHDLMAQHYGTINRVSTKGIQAITTDVADQIKAEFGANEDTQILGAHEFLIQYPEYVASTLNAINDEPGKSKKIASGTYAIQLEVAGTSIIVLNGFHPAQLAMYYEPGIAILVLALRQSGDWSELRQQITGSTDPSKAPSGSIRGQLYARQKELGVDISRLKNGIHVSAGPIEGMSELARYFTDWDVPTMVNATDTCFGQEVTDAFGQSVTEKVASNPIVHYKDKGTWLFDLTEEMNPAPVLDMIREIRGQLGVREG